MRRSTFVPRVDGLESRELLTVSPHQAQRAAHTGALIGGYVDMQVVNTGTNASDTIITYSGTGNIRVAGHTVAATVTITFADDQAFTMTIDDGQGDTLQASGLSVADDSAGNFHIDGGTGQWAGLNSTGIWYFAQDADGDYIFTLDPHQYQSHAYSR